MYIQNGTYFKSLYDNLVKLSSTFPTDDPSPNLVDCLSNDQRLNFRRAEVLARQHNLPTTVVQHLRELTILQFVIDYANKPGTNRIINEYEYSEKEIGRLAGLIAQEKYYPCFSFSKNTEMAISENWGQIWHQNYEPILCVSTVKESFWNKIKRFFTKIFTKNR